MQKTGVFGSAFNPPTQGHRDVLIQAAPHFDNILLVPSVAHAFHKKTLPLTKRVELLEAFCVDISSVFCKFEISLIESELLRTEPETPVYTWTVMDTLSKQYPDTTFSFIRGPDNANPEIWQRFYRYQDIEQRWPIFTAEEIVDARSSKVREALASISLAKQSSRTPLPKQLRTQLQEWLTPAVMALILEQQLYYSP